MDTEKIQRMTDRELYSTCKHFGEISLKYRWKFAGLLPEVMRRKLYKKKGYSSIFEFAAKLAGMSEENVRRVLNLERKLEERGANVLKTMLTDGKASASKLNAVAGIATKENQNFLAAQVKLLPRSALETLVRDTRGRSQNYSLQKQKIPPALIPGDDLTERTKKLLELELSQEIIDQLHELKRKGLDVNEILGEFLSKRSAEIARLKEKISEEARAAGPGKSRYIPKKTRDVIAQEYGTKCSLPTCDKPSQEIHHSQRYSLAKIHDPNFLAPLCKDHHTITHTIDLQFQSMRSITQNSFWPAPETLSPP